MNIRHPNYTEKKSGLKIKVPGKLNVSKLKMVVFLEVLELFFRTLHIQHHRLSQQHLFSVL